MLVYFLISVSEMFHINRREIFSISSTYADIIFDFIKIFRWFYVQCFFRATVEENYAKSLNKMIKPNHNGMSLGWELELLIFLCFRKIVCLHFHVIERY